MAEEKMKLDSSDPPAHNQSNVYNVDLEKGLCLDTQQDINKLSYPSSFNSNNSKKTIVNRFQNSLIKKSYDEALKQLSHRFPDNLVLKNRNYREQLTLFFSLMCTLAISYILKLLSWLKQVYLEAGCSWALFGPIGLMFMLWAILNGFFFNFPLLTVRITRTFAHVIIGVSVVIAVLVGCVGAAGVSVVSLVCWGFYNILVFGLGLKLERSAENIGSPTLPRHQQRDDTVAPLSTTTRNEEIERQNNPTTQS
ncbi:hypothetical protein SPOG_04478 [Schizosaccharomyces cryophilus OY26]|uniref:Uncharacterized protein n=3 Tax=Schizosaccharomyces cryophilus (strain OY26 / ATCC MYA-4695 / CBS 11777 / NBRC 106824 / NRRL Y48691) TaxID=653667 RepID=S9W0X9_SCHCR|nr:uncharacterized protein SPOG_04478 [Schizosaccharomyces cryophilus OY26]EPY53523.1 hypothetical protein SPOG_04478 [Schizosaccharomyces cryophilus OY26]